MLTRNTRVLIVNESLTVLVLFASIHQMLKVRLKRVGRKNDPSFRLILTESTSGPKSGRVIETFGSYNPHEGQEKASINGERILYWVSKGAQVSPTVHNMLLNHKIITGKKVNVLPKKRPILKEVKQEEKIAASAPAPAAEVAASEVAS
ncbi:MAG: small subunit ribosomal protein S16 [Parcubacteria group bacterium Greene0416_14]|nr:MAG: small subunit ribosomal protein S16 [Parcubacteria group bacterium Greene0416_14]TSD01519.1 MAG: small subunit ribosomal protein S16 [Parcubacteria group bacterium Greene1014_15]TSD08026.1 MAG: small subunit ribosomal protein S16 [Parcubacteria group bacterium Greene0714_4]